MILNVSSYIFGLLAELKIPRALRKPIIGTFAKIVSADISEAEKSIDNYDSIAKFFTRNLKPGLRSPSGEVVSPVDGYLRSVSKIEDDTLIQAKGKNYSVANLLSDSAKAKHFKDGLAYNLYLSPSNYHHVHFPVSGDVIASTYIPGSLWPVNNFAIENITSLFTRNERIVTYMQSKYGLVAVIMVGACNVGKMTVTYDNIITNNFKRTIASNSYNTPKKVLVGERLGTFNLGSTVIMLFERGVNLSYNQIGSIKLGTALGNH